MVRKCSVKGCRSNYDSILRNGSAVTPIFSFPKEPRLRKRWLEVIQRTDFSPTVYSGICIKHFHPYDIEARQKRIRIRPEAIPFMATVKAVIDGPTAEIPVCKVVATTNPAGAVEQEPEFIVVQTDPAANEDFIVNFDNFKEMVNDRVNLGNWFLCRKENMVHIFCVDVDVDYRCPIRISNSIKVYDSLRIRLFRREVAEAEENLKWILGREFKIARWSQLEQILVDYDPAAQKVEEAADEQSPIMSGQEVTACTADSQPEANAPEVAKAMADPIEKVVEVIAQQEQQEPEEINSETTVPSTSVSLVSPKANDEEGNESATSFTDMCDMRYSSDEENELGNTPVTGANKPSGTVDEKKSSPKKDTVAEKSLKCYICASEYKTEQDFELHILGHRWMLPYHCKRCTKGDYVMKTLASLNKHYHMHQKPLKCSFCDVRFTDCMGKSNHERNKHTQAGPINCEVCGKMCVSMRSYRRHKQKHDNPEMFKCNICDRVLSCHSELQRHLGTHTGEKPNKCSFCDRSFNRRSNLADHKRRHHSLERPFECNECGKSYSFNAELKRHMEIHDPNLKIARQTRENANRRNVDRQNAKVFTCEVCNQTFTTSLNYRAHKAKHEKRYQCSFCGVRFARQQEFEDHENIHTGFTPYECEICGKKFRSSTTYYGHRKLHKKKTSRLYVPTLEEGTQVGATTTVIVQQQGVADSSTLTSGTILSNAATILLATAQDIVVVESEHVGPI